MKDTLDLLGNEILVYTPDGHRAAALGGPVRALRRLVGAEDLRAHAGPPRPDAHRRLARLGADHRRHPEADPEGRHHPDAGRQEATSCSPRTWSSSARMPRTRRSRSAPRTSAARSTSASSMSSSISSLVVVGLLMAGWASNNKWSLFGAHALRGADRQLRDPVALALLAVVMIAGTFDLQEINRAQAGWFWNWFMFQKFPFMFAGVRHLLRGLARRDEPDAVRHPRGGVGAGRRVPHRVRRDEVRASSSSPSTRNMFAVSAIGRQRSSSAAGTARSAIS